MPRRTKYQHEETITTFYGINPTTFEVERVSLTRGRTLKKWTKDAAFMTHPIPPGRQPKNEIVIMWGLTELIEVLPHESYSEGTKRKVDELRAKAKEMRASGGRCPGSSRVLTACRVTLPSWTLRCRVEMGWSWCGDFANPFRT